MKKDEYTAKTGVVVMLDALGVRNMTIEQCRSFLDVRDDVIVAGLKSSYQYIKGRTDDLSQILGKPKASEVEVAGFQDTIILTWEVPGDPEKFAIPLGRFALSQLMWETMRRGYLFRGAMSHGEYIHVGQTVLGPAVCEAANWYEMADWAGIVATPRLGMAFDAFCQRMANHEPFVPSLQARWVKYAVPLKKASRLPMWCVSWPIEFLVSDPKRDPAPHQSGKEFFLALMSGLSRPIGAESKYVNTATFFEWYQDEIWPRIRELDGKGAFD